MIQNNATKLSLYLFLGALLVAAAPLVGSTSISMLALVRGELSPTESQIIWEIRAPRVLAAFLTGAGLSIGGMIFQTLFRNVLATPFTLGVSSSAAFGATLFFACGLQWGFFGISGSAFFAVTAALSTTLVVYLVSLKNGSRGEGNSTLLLSGVVISFFFSSLILLLQYISDFTGIVRITRWLMGSLDLVTFQTAEIIALPVLLAAALTWFYAHDLDILTLGEEMALTKGVEVHRIRSIFTFAVSLTVGVIVSFCGPIGFVGIIVPHICRALFGAKHKLLSIAVPLFGGAFLVVCDTFARSLIAPYEIPVGVITSLLGGPFFLWLLLRFSDSVHD